MNRLTEYLLLAYSLTGTVSVTISQTVMALGAAVAAWDRGRTIRWRSIGLERPVLAWAAAAVLATVFAAEPTESFLKLRKLLLFAMLWWPAAAVTRRWGLGRLYMGLLFGAGTTSLYGVLTFFLQGGPELAVRIEGFTGFYLTNHGLLLLCTFPAVLFVFCPVLRSSHRWGAGIAATSILAAQLLGRLPGAWLGTAAGFLFLAARRRQPWLAVAVVGAALTLVTAPGIFRDAACDMTQLTSEGNVARFRVWSNALRLIAEDPLTGQGLQDLRSQYARIKGPDDPLTGHMRSVPMQVAASMGLPGVVAFGWLIFAMFRKLAAARRDAGEAPFLVATIDGATSGLVGVLAGGLVEWNWGDSEILSLLFFLVGTGIAAGRLAADSR